LIPSAPNGTIVRGMDAFFLLDQQLDPSARWLFLCLVTLTIIYAVARPLFKKKDPLAQQPFKSSLAQQRAVERQMQNVLVDLSQMARQITAQLDTRAAKLEALIKEADQKITAMNSAPSTPREPAPEAAMEPEIHPDPRHADIYALADQGRTPQEIARQLNLPSGEIELILALRPG
jgi:hypothetical protein